MICVKDAAMNVVHLSPEWQVFTGLDLTRSFGRGWLAAIHADDRAVVDDTLHRAARERRGCSLRFRLMHRSGVGVWVSDDAMPSFSPEDRSFLGLMGCISQIAGDGSAMTAEGRIGEFRSPMPTAPMGATRDAIVGHLLLARALADREDDRAIRETLDLSLYLARRRLDYTTH